jgi:hypothetical protein
MLMDYPSTVIYLAKKLHLFFLESEDSSLHSQNPISSLNRLIIFRNCFLNINFNIILLYLPTSPKLFLRFTFLENYTSPTYSRIHSHTYI